MEQTEFHNRVTLRGTLREQPVFSHENHGRNFYRFFLEVSRLSGAVDTLPVIAEERLLNFPDLFEGAMLTVSGQVRSHNLPGNGRKHLLIFVFASAIVPEDGENENEVELNAVICREPTFRRTPLGREICDVMLAVPRAYHRADYLPCILWGRIAQRAAQCSVGDSIRIHGRLQSRIYTKITEDSAEERTAYEISALTAIFPEAEDLR